MTGTPKYWHGDQVIYTNEHHLRIRCEIVKPETRWGKDKNGYVFYFVRWTDGSVSKGVPQSRLTSADTDL